jgi:hypothetical protein
VAGQGDRPSPLTRLQVGEHDLMRGANLTIAGIEPVRKRSAVRGQRIAARKRVKTCFGELREPGERPRSGAIPVDQLDGVIAFQVANGKLL